VLAEAGQTTANADTKRISVSHKEGGNAQEVDLDAALKTPSLNVELAPGDTITVPSKAIRSVRVEGEVSRPGPRNLDESKTAYAAIQAAGPSASADWKRVALRRKGSNIPLIIDLSPVRTGQLKDDLELQEGDQITVMSKFAGTATLRGEIRTPGEKDLNGPTQLWDFIISAGGGFTDKADQMRIQVIHPGKPMRLVNLVSVASGLRRSDDPELQVEGGDVIFIPTGTASLKGEVKNTGERPLGTSTHLQDFIMNTGGGFTEHADRSHIQVYREGKLLQTLNLAEAASGDNMDALNLELLPGDAVFVPNDDKNRFAIVGGVKKPGTFPVKPNMTLLDAVAAADGFTERATHKQFVVAPASLYGPDGKLKMQGTPGKSHAKKDDLSKYGLVVIDYKQLLKGDPTQNVAIHPGDRILIPEELPDSQKKKPSFLQSIMQMVPLATVFMGGYGGGYGGGFGGY
jgi:protein involved in polysaccharide export with SLBB domain